MVDKNGIQWRQLYNKRWACPYAEASCLDRNCEKCGWYPPEDARRRDRLRRGLPPIPAEDPEESECLV